MISYACCIFVLFLISMLWYSFVLMLYKNKFPGNNDGNFVSGIAILYVVVTAVLLCFLSLLMPGALFHDLLIDPAKTKQIEQR